MLHPELKDFIVASVGAAASFIGLLFVAISFVMNDDKDSQETLTAKRILAESSYAALISIFFIGLVALIPSTTISYVTIALAFTGLGSAFHYIKVVHNTTLQRYGVAVLGFSIFVYVMQLLFGIFLLFQNNNYYANNYAFMTLVLFLFTMALTRAWELTGIRRDYHKK